MFQPQLTFAFHKLNISSEMSTKFWR